jgi:hypothetical protein
MSYFSYGTTRTVCVAVIVLEPDGPETCSSTVIVKAVGVVTVGATRGLYVFPAP